jgi:hypothetical protein
MKPEKRHRIFLITRFWLFLLVCASPAHAQFVTKTNQQFMYQGNPITFYGASFDPAAEGFASAWHKSSFTSTIHKDITNSMAAGQNILRPTDYWDGSTPGQTYNDAVLWSNMDFLLADCKSNGMFVLMDISAWKKVLDQEGLDDTDTNNWLAFIDYVSARYKTNTTIAYWSIIGEPAVPTNSSSASNLVAYYNTLTTYLYNDDSNHLICAGAFIHMEDHTNLNWWQNIYALPHNDVAGYKTYSQHDLNLTPTIGSVAASNNKILVNEEFGMPQYMGDGTNALGSNYNSIVTSVSTFYTNVYNAGLSAGAVGFMFWNLDNLQGNTHYDIWPTYMPVTWGTIQHYSPPPQPPLNLIATTVSGSQINLNWTRNAEATVTGYNVFRNTNSGFSPGANYLLASGVTTNAYSNTGLSPGVSYYYLVTAVNQLNHESAPSVQAPPGTNTSIASSPLAYEPFSYPTGSLTNSGNTGGTGWLAANWSDPTVSPWSGNNLVNVESAPTVASPGLNYSNLLTSSNALSISAATALRAWNLPASGLFSQTGNALWFSFLFSPGGSANKLNVMPLANTNTSDYTRGSGVQIFYAAGVGTANPFIEDGGGSANNSYFTNTGPVLPSSGTVLIVGKMTWNGATTSTTNDTLSVWLNPTPGTAPQTGSANSLTANGLLDKGGWFVIRGGSSFAGQIDELRLGTNYASVVQSIPPVTLSAQPAGANLQLTWSLGTLLQSTNVTGPWFTNAAASPYTLSPTNPQMFYRVRVQ